MCSQTKFSNLLDVNSNTHSFLTHGTRIIEEIVYRRLLGQRETTGGREFLLYRLI